MFYSQTFLGRKGPLGTVWCAAHLQNRLRKSHYTATDIVSTVDRIMFPEVPIALRMSGHLLLGVVRIYSMKVEYLAKDCEAAKVRLLKAFVTVDINLPDNATTARPESVTLPPVLELDALELDDSHLTPEGSPDNHLRSHEDITLPDQFPPSGGRDPFIAITFDADDDDFMTEKILHERDDHANVRPVDMDNIPADTLNADIVLKDTGISIETEDINDVGISNDPGTSNLTEVVTQEPGASDHTEVLASTPVIPDSGPSDQTERVGSMLLDDDSPPQFEVLRDAVHETGFGNIPPFMQDQTSYTSEPTRPVDAVLGDKEILSPIAEDNSPIRGQPAPSDQQMNPPNSAASEYDPQLSFGNASPGFALRSSPSDQEIEIQPSPPAQPPQRGQKRKIFFDEAPVLKNKHMKKLLDNTSDLLRKKRPAPSSALDVWRLQKKLRKEQVLFEPSLTGLSDEICNLFKNDYIASKPHLFIAQDVIPDGVARASSDSSNEHIQDNENTSSPSPVPDAIPETGVRTTAAVPEVVEGSIIDASPAPAPDIVQEPRTSASPDHVVKSTVEPAITAQTSMKAAESYGEIERLRNIESPIGMSFDLLPSPPRMNSPRNPSPSRTDNVTRALSDSLGPETTALTRPTIGIDEMRSTSDFGASTSTFNTDSGTARMSLDDRLEMDQRLSDIPEMMNDINAEDLYFLEADCTPPGSQGSQCADGLSVRTRAVAQYLQRSSPRTATADGSSSDDLSLSQILEGRKRKLCARMFYEVLVLKSYGLIDVQQDQAYGDVKLKLTPTISKV